ncbi:MAG: arginase family protein [Saprospiraceae bacterium]|nr:arginase family protein [Saprospiraceae bacterium]
MENNKVITNYIISPYLLIEREKGEDAAHKLYNTLSGKVFQVKETAMSILRFLEIPKTFEGLMAAFPQYPTGDLQQALSSFVSRGLVFQNDILEDQLVILTRLKHTLFGLNDETNPHFANLCFVGIPYGGGNPKSVGCAHFSEKLREYTNEYKLHLDAASAGNYSLEAVGIDSSNSCFFELLQKDLIKDLGNLFVSIHESKSYIYRKIEKTALQIFQQGNIPFFLGGDHSVTYPIVKAASAVFDDIYIVHMDAHTDTYTSKYDSLNHAEKVHHHGNFASRCLEISKVKGIYQMGIRGIFNLMGRPHNSKQHVFWCSDLKKSIHDELDLSFIPMDAQVYLTIDIDVLDPVVAPATATPVANGLDLSELIQLLQLVLTDRRIIGIDLVEVNPDMDMQDRTMQTSVELILNIINLFTLNNFNCEEVGSEQLATEVLN